MTGQHRRDDLGQRRAAGIRSIGGGLGIVLLTLAAIGAAEAQAQSEPGQGQSVGGAEDALDVPGRPTTRTPGGAGDPGLDDLLRLPSDFKTRPAERPVAGVSEDEWRRRFGRAEKAIVDAREALVATKRELDGLAETGGGSQWSVAPPGASGQQTTSPLSFKLRQQLQRQREELDAAEKALRELRIEADLAGVPAAWRVVAASTPPAPQASAPN